MILLLKCKYFNTIYICVNLKIKKTLIYIFWGKLTKRKVKKNYILKNIF